MCVCVCVCVCVVVGGGEEQNDNGAEGCLAYFEDGRPRVYFSLKQQQKNKNKNTQNKNKQTNKQTNKQQRQQRLQQKPTTTFNSKQLVWALGQSHEDRVRKDTEVVSHNILLFWTEIIVSLFFSYLSTGKI